MEFIYNIDLTDDEYARLWQAMERTPQDICAQIAHLALDLDSDPDGLCEWVAQNREVIFEEALSNPLVPETLVLAYRHAISRGSGACANDLGALYYMGELVQQDYAHAAFLYELAARMGCYQSIINLGYIYEYGRLGEPDYAKSYEHYALASVMLPTCEALYKLGDAYARGHGVEKDMAIAAQLWLKSYGTATAVEEAAQPAIRLAGLFVNPELEIPGIEYDPLRALQLYQQAEVGLRVDITQNGMSYYRKRLEEAIAGQVQARSLLE